MSLIDELQAFREKSEAGIPPEIREKFQKQQMELKERQIEASAKKQGDKMDNFELSNAKGDKVSLENVLKNGPVVISFYRGGWCPYCNMELRALQSCLPEIKALGAQLLAISPQVPDKSLTTQEKNELEFEVLSDQGNEVAKALGLVFEVAEELRPIYKQWGADLTEFHGDEKYELPIPSTIVVDTDGTIIHAHHDLDYTNRMDPGKILDVLKNKYLK